MRKGFIRPQYLVEPQYIEGYVEKMNLDIKGTLAIH